MVSVWFYRSIQVKVHESPYPRIVTNNDFLIFSAGSATVKLAQGNSSQTKFQSSAGPIHATASQGEQSSSMLLR